MADIAAGDQVCGVDGHPCTVLAVSAVMHDRPCYRVTFSDGSRIVADADHQWVTRHTYRPWAPAPRYPGQAETVTTAQIAASVLRPRTGGTREHNHHIDVPPALEMYGTQVLPVSPYVLGVWLGDGTSTSAAITVGARDVEALQGFLIAEGVPVRRRRPRGKTAWTLTLTAGRGGPRGVSVQARLRALGVLGNKHIPAPYLDAPVADRWALLQGLMDTDGTVNRCGGRTTPRCSFSTTRRRLADEVWQLARSLGLKATKRSRPARIRGKTCGTVWEVDYPAARSTAVFRLPRKQTLLPKTLGRRSRTLAIVACEPVARVPVRCLTVDAADGMFLCGHGAIPTHNSGLVAALVLAHLVGPLRRPAWRAVVCSLTGNLAKELRRQVEEIARASGLYDAEAAAASRPPTGDRIASYQTPQPGRIVGPDGDVTCLAADKATGHAVGADLAIVDEAGLLQEKHRDLWNAMQSCMSGRAGRLLAISIRGDGPMFSELAARHADPAVHWVEYAAPDGGALDDPATWAAANPGLASGIKSLAHMQDRARAVAASPLDQASFRAHDLNLPQSPSRELLCDPEDWHRCEVASAAALPPRDGLCIVGFDLGYNESMSAVVASWPGTCRFEVWVAFPDIPDLVTRGRADGIGGLYVQMAERGELRLYPGRVVPVGAFFADVARALDGETVGAAAADSCRRAEAEQALADAGVVWPVTWRANAAGGPAGHDGSHDVRAFQRAVIQREIRCVESLVMRQAILETDIKRTSMGHPRLGRHRTRGRIDAVAAAILAVGAATHPESNPLVRYYAAGGKVEIVGV